MSRESERTEWRQTQPIVDMHTHISADCVDDAIHYMDLVGVETAVDISANIGQAFEEKQAAFAEFPGRFGLFGGFDFEGFGSAEWIDREQDRMERLVEAGAVGFKIHKAFGMEYTDQSGNVVPVDDERIAPLFDRAAELDTIIAFHIADPKSFFVEDGELDQQWVERGWWWGDREEYPYQWWDLIRQLERVIDRHPETTFLGVHFGCASEEVGYVADVMRHHPNYLLDVSARLPWIGEHRPDLVHDVFVEFQDRIMFGTDFAVRDPLMLGVPQGFEPTDEDVQAFFDAHWGYFETDTRGIDNPTPWIADWTIDAIDLPKDVLEKFYVTNAQRHLGV